MPPSTASRPCCPADGVLVACADDAGARALAERTLARGNTRVVLYGTADDAAIRLHDGGPGRMSGSRRRRARSASNCRFPGRHNALNAAAAFAVALELGVAPDSRGRRHWPTSPAPRAVSSSRARAAASASTTTTPTTPRKSAPPCPRPGAVAGEHKVHVLFQPHLFSRTREFAREFAEALNTADTALVLDIYPAREDPIPGVTSELIAEHLGSGGRLVGPGGEAVQALLAAAGARGHRADRRRRRRHGLRAADRRGPDGRGRRCLAPGAPPTGADPAPPAPPDRLPAAVRRNGHGRHFGVQERRGRRRTAAVRRTAARQNPHGTPDSAARTMCCPSPSPRASAAGGSC